MGAWRPCDFLPRLGIEMPCTNRDASLLTKQRRGIAEYSYYLGWKSQTVNNTTGFNNQALSGPCSTRAETLSEIKLGCQTAYAINNDAVKLGMSTFSAAVGFPNVAYDGNVARYPPNFSHGGAPSGTGTS